MARQSFEELDCLCATRSHSFCYCFYQAAPSKQERLEKATQQMREYAQTAQFRVAEEVPEVRM